jgi:solute:Na+ symporter, SSS family
MLINSIRLAFASMFFGFTIGIGTVCVGQAPAQLQLHWNELPQLPDDLGLAGPIVGVSNEILFVGGGANFPRPVWENQKQWLRDFYGLKRKSQHAGPNLHDYVWEKVGQFPIDIAYAACATTSQGIVIAGGNNAEGVFALSWLLSWDSQQQQLRITSLPNLPQPCVYGQACAIGDVVYVAGGQSGNNLSSAMSNLWRLDLKQQRDNLHWEQLPPCPGPARAFNITASYTDQNDSSLIVIGGRYEVNGEPRFLQDCWEYVPSQQQWRARADLPRAITAGTAISMAASTLVVLSGDDGSLYAHTDQLRDAHPGFPRTTYAYDIRSDTWREAGPSPANQVTTLATSFEGKVVLPSGETRPRVRTPKVWAIDASFQ